MKSRDSFTKKDYLQFWNFEISDGTAKNDIQLMLDKYGTHIVTEASVGCMMDMTLTFDKSESYDLESEAEQKSRSIFGRSSGNSSSTKTDHMTCNINNENCIRIFGDGQGSLTVLDNGINVGAVKIRSKVLGGHKLYHLADPGGI